MTDLLANSLQGLSQFGMVASMAQKGGLGQTLGKAAKFLTGIDAFDQEIPYLGAATDALTVVAGGASLIASIADDVSKTDPKKIVAAAAPIVAQQMGA
tara:strand:- start:3210 stop:3503 length:294 start_codon:yes stop_codon:yes gene_type:complete